MAAKHEYQVVARRYRPQNFEELIGQEHIAKALANAIQTSRIGHAYLFTGARGVGKTSAARIFAKALNCATGPTPKPCGVCEICQSISSGEDIDVLEIDGASNRGIDEIRTLRQNVSVRPVRARFKIYIIDEVHMLTREAFNALLKTLEEPPEHVKFIFCTTEVGKIPITILSRCQRFDFAGIQTPEIARRLNEIVEAEGLAAEPAAIELLARRALGSMRDGQSLLEQVLAFAAGKVTLNDVYQLLGTANDEVLMSVLDNIVHRDTAAILRTIAALVEQGSNPDTLLEQLFGYLRDLMAILAGCGSESFLAASPTAEARMREYADSLGLETVLAAMQIADHTLSRLKTSVQVRLLVEMAFIRICALRNLDNLSDLINVVQSENSWSSGSAPVVQTVVQSAVQTGVQTGAQTAVQTPSQTVQVSKPIQTPQPVPEEKPKEKAPIVPPVELRRRFSDEITAPPEIPTVTEPSKPEEVGKVKEVGEVGEVVDIGEVGDVSSIPDDIFATLRQTPAPAPVATASGSSSFRNTYLMQITQLASASSSALKDFTDFEAKETEGQVTMKVTYPHQAMFTMKTFRQSEEKTALETNLSEVLGKRVKLEFDIIAVNVPRQVESTTDIRTLYKNPLIHTVDEMFGGKIANVSRIPVPTAETETKAETKAEAEAEAEAETETKNN